MQCSAVQYITAQYQIFKLLTTLPPLPVTHTHSPHRLAEEGLAVLRGEVQVACFYHLHHIGIERTQVKVKK
jgi:hypothetical protein